MKDIIIDDLKKTYGITFNDITPITGGLLNLKWKINTNQGELLVKQYSTKRFNQEKLKKIEHALQRQILLKKNKIPCPFLWQSQDRIIRWLNDKTAYMVMDFCSGKTETSETITTAQMLSLGSSCALMHQAFAQLPDNSINKLPDFGGYTVDALWNNFNSRIKTYSSETNIEYQHALISQERILKEISPNFFQKFPKGFTHEDFHTGNILFNENSVSAIIDFDRNCFSYVWHDIGRAILSFALEENKINLIKTNAFLQGYSKHLKLDMSNIVDSIRLLWCIETPWWIQAEFFDDCGEIPKGFKNEMLWITKNWFELDSLFGIK